MTCVLHVHVLWLLAQCPDANPGWNGPGPPDTLPHSYYFMVYEQSGVLQLDSTVEYAGAGCPERLAGR